MRDLCQADMQCGSVSVVAYTEEDVMSSDGVFSRAATIMNQNTKHTTPHCRAKFKLPISSSPTKKNLYLGSND